VRAVVLRLRAALGELEPEQAALILAVGLVLGVFPVVGCPTLLCLLAALGLRLNPGALQLVNHISSPLQFMLLLPLGRAGAWLCGATPGDTSAVQNLAVYNLAAYNPAVYNLAVYNLTVYNLAVGALHAVAGWLCTCVPLGVLLYVILLVLMRKSRFSWSNDVKSPA